MKRNVAPEGISYPEMNDLAAQVPIGSEGVTILPFGNGAYSFVAIILMF